MNLWKCPSGHVLREKMSTALRGNSHCLVLIPEGQDPSAFQDDIRAHLEKWEGSVHSFLVDGDQSLKDGLRLAVAQYGEEDTRRFLSIEELVRRTSDQGSYLLASVSRDLDSRSLGVLKSELLELSTASKHCIESSGYLSWRLLLVVPANTGMSLPADVCLSPFECWGWFRAYDLEFAIDRHLHKFEGRPADYRWIQALCLSVGRMGPDLVERIAEKMPKELEDVRQILREHELFVLAEKNKTLVESLLQTRCPTGSLWPDRPRSGVLDECWRLGFFNLDCHGQPGVHLAALEACKKTRTLEHMVVHGQIQIYLPLVQRVHNLILQTVERVSAIHPQAGKNPNGDTHKYDIGPLHHVVNCHKGYYDPDLVETARLWREVRNTLAHNHFLPYELAVDAYAALQSLDSRARSEERGA